MERSLEIQRLYSIDNKNVMRLEMRQRGERYWAWADPALHCRTHDETLDDGMMIDVQVRLSTPALLKCSSAFMRLAA